MDTTLETRLRGLAIFGVQAMTRKKGRRDAPGQMLAFDAERHCVKCGRRLRGDKSVSRQYGPTCWRKHKAAPKTEV